MAVPPTVSVIITVFNGEKFLPLAVESILRQSFSDFELIIVDDGSTDSTPLQLGAINDHRVRIIRNGENQGLPAALNIGINAAAGVFCAFLDHDDIALPTRLECQVDFLRSHPPVGLIGSAVELIDASGKGLTRIKMPQDSVAIRWIGLLECPMRQSTLFGRTEVIKRHLYSAQFLFYPDWDFIMRMARDTEVYNLPQTLAQYRRHGTNMSKVNRAQLDEDGIDLALREIRAALPDFPISRDEVAQLRCVLFSAGQRSKKSLAMTRWALTQYGELHKAFGDKYLRLANLSGPQTPADQPHSERSANDRRSR
jgi:glycosyltransferase involved in cell wall biosynthesis